MYCSYVLDYEELEYLEESFLMEINERAREILARLNREGRLRELLDLLGLGELLPQAPEYQTYRTGKIVVIGESEIDESVIFGIGKKYGIPKERFELCLEYDKAKAFNFKKMQWQPEYSLVLVGPMGHSITGKGKYSSMIACLEQDSGYPPVVRLGENKLKITKAGFRKAIESAVNSGIIGVSGA